MVGTISVKLIFLFILEPIEALTTVGITGRDRVTDPYHLVEVSASTAPRSGQATELQKETARKTSYWGQNHGKNIYKYTCIFIAHFLLHQPIDHRITICFSKFLIL